MGHIGTREPHDLRQTARINWSAGSAHKVLERIRVHPGGHELEQIVISKQILSNKPEIFQYARNMGW